MNRSRRPWRRRSLVAVLAGTLSLALTACVGQGNSVQSPSADSGSAAGLPSADVSTTITLWTYQTLPNGKWWDDAIARFNQQYPNVKVETTNIPYAEMTSKLLGSGISKSIPDGVLYNPADSDKLLEAGIIQDFTPLWNDFADKGQFPESVVWKVDDKVLSVQGYLNTTAIWYNKTILDKAGVTKVPTTIDEF
ncbi:MAG: extracellular solute-binding protein, partial [Propionicimonas sp.]|nr:extracellular solute-binding protein [Propionicimonas sp.]